MIYICYGMTKSGSTLAYELTRALLEVMGHSQQRLSCSIIGSEKKINFLDGSIIRRFNRETLQMIEMESPPPCVVAFKTHAPPTTMLRKLAAEGLIIGQANFRDPRDTIISLLDAGERNNRRGRGSFMQITTWQKALNAYQVNLQHFDQWADVPGFITTHYEEVAFRSEIFLHRVATQFGFTNLDRLDFQDIVNTVKTKAFPQYNKGIRQRHRNELSLNQTLFLIQRFGSRIEAYMSEDIDSLDRALIEIAPRLQTPTLAIESLPRPRFLSQQLVTSDKTTGNSESDSQFTQSMSVNRTLMINTFFKHHLLMHTHLEKTAGTSFIKAMQSLLGREYVHDLRGPQKIRPGTMTDIMRSRIRLLSGHFHFGAWEYCFARRAIYVACVRDPFERFRSFHAFVSVRPNHPQFSKIGRRSLGETIEFFIHQQDGAAINYLARYFSGSKEQPSFKHVRDHLENRYLAVVPHHRVSQLVAAIAQVFNMEPPANKVFNAAGDYPASDDGKALFIEHNTLDYQIFTYVNIHYERWLDRVLDRLSGFRI